MKQFSILLLLMGFLSFTGASLTLKAEEQNTLESLALKIKRSAERSKEFALSQEGGNLLLFLLSAGYLAYLPRHLSKASSNIIDNIITCLRFSNTGWGYYFYYELTTLLAGYICLKTGKPYWEKLKKI